VSAATRDRRVAVVTGAGRGIGLAIARSLHAAGIAIMLNDVDADAVAETVAAFTGGPTVVACPGDIADESACAQLVDDALDRLGGLDVVVNNAGVTIPALARDLSLADWNLTLAVNLTAPFLLSVAAAESMRERGVRHGRIVNISSIAGKRMSVHAGAAYTASKAGLLGLTRHLAFEYAPDGITVNAVCPGGIGSPGFRELAAARGVEKRLAQIPVGRFLEPEEVAGAVAFLASEAAAGITGVALDVDGGSSLGWEPVSEYRAWMEAVHTPNARSKGAR
jgi:NAD(P)-dependent dehydrogenase (short-subunit alcohol dehydrogenase family)